MPGPAVSTFTFRAGFRSRPVPLGWTKPTTGGQPVSHREWESENGASRSAHPVFSPLSLSLQLKHLLSKPSAYDGGARLMLIL